MTTYDSLNFDTAYEQRELDMLPQIGMTRAQAGADIGNPISGEPISREAVLGYLTMTNEALALRDAARAEGTTLVISLSEVKVFLDAMALEVTALPQAWPAAPEAGEAERDAEKVLADRLYSSVTSRTWDHPAYEAYRKARGL